MTLTEATIYIKQGARYAVIGIIGLIILWFVGSFTISTFQKIFPAKEVPTVAYGKVPPPTLPAAVTSKNLSFVLDTVDGKLPSLATVLPIYKFDTQTSGLLNADQAKSLAASFGFGTAPSILNSNTYQFVDPHNPGQSLTVNIVSKNFSLTSDYTNPTISKVPPADPFDTVIVNARAILKSHSLLADDLTSSTATVTPVKLSGTNLVRATSTSDANYVRVDIWRSGVGSYQIVGPSKDQALINLILASGSSSNALVGLSYTYWPFSASNYATYPLLTVAKAFDELKSGQAALISPSKASFTDVRIQNISLAYFEDARFQPYLQPIYLFDGIAVPQGGAETTVRFYLPAVDPSYLSQ